MAEIAQTPIERAALAILPLLIEASNLLSPVSHHERDAEHAINRVFDSIIFAADIVSYRLLRRGMWHNGEAAADLAARLDAASAELAAIGRAMDATDEPSQEVADAPA